MLLCESCTGRLRQGPKLHELCTLLAAMNPLHWLRVSGPKIPHMA